MKLVKFIPYLYIVFALFFFYDALVNYLNGTSYIISLLFGAVATFMFFFRRHFNNKFKNGQK